MLYIVTLTYFCKVTNAAMWISRKRLELTKIYQLSLLWRLKFAIDWDYWNVILRNLDLNFQGQTFQGAILTKKGWKNANINIAIRKTGNCNRLTQLRMLHIMILTYIFKVTKFWNVNISKTVRAGEKCSMTFKEADICNRMMRPLRMLYSVTLTFMFKVKHILVMHW